MNHRRILGWAGVIAAALVLCSTLPVQAQIGPHALRQAGPPIIKDLDPRRVECGKEHEIHIFGSNLLPGSEIVFEAGGVEVRNVEYIDEETVWVWVFVDEFAPAGTFPVSVYGENGEGRLEDALTIICEEPTPPTDDVGPVDEPGEQPPPPEDERPPDEPLPPYVGPTGPNTLLIIGIVGGLGIGALGVLGVVTLSVNALQKGRRRRWGEEHARQGKLPDQCEAKKYYCTLDGTELKFRRSKLTEVRLMATDATSRQDRQDRTLHGAPIRELDRMFLTGKLGRPMQDFEQDIAKVSGWMAQEIGGWLVEARTQQYVDLTAHFESVEVEQRFTLYRCVGKAPKSAWKKVDEWQISRQMARDLPIGSFYPQASDPARTSTDLASLITHFIRPS